MKRSIIKSVGNNGFNAANDVMTVQSLLNVSIKRLTPLIPLKIDGDCGPITIGMIIEFQKRVMDINRPDGRVDPGKATITKLNELSIENTEDNRQVTAFFDGLLLLVQQWFSTGGNNNREIETKTSKALTDTDYMLAANLLGVEVAVIKAVARVESSGGGFLSNGKPKILFEGHQFSKYSKRKFDAIHPTLSYKSYNPKYYKGGNAEYTRYETAKSLDRVAAMMSTSWGKFQIMGFNYKQAGFGDIEKFVTAMHHSEGKQLEAFVNFLKSEKLSVHLKTKSWAKFAKGYNGPLYAKNKYDIRLEQAYNAYSAGAK